MGMPRGPTVVMIAPLLTPLLTGAPRVAMLNPFSMEALPSLSFGSWLMEANSTALIKCSRLFENGKAGLRPVTSRVKTPMKVSGRSSLSTNFRAASKAKARVSLVRSFRIRQTILTVRRGLEGGRTWAASMCSASGLVAARAISLSASARTSRPGTKRKDLMSWRTPSSYTDTCEGSILVTSLPWASRTTTSRSTSRV